VSPNKKAQQETADSQIVRALSLVHAIANAKRGVSLKQLADRRGWNLRALYRDVDALKRAQFPIEHVHGKYSMPADWLPPSMVGVGRDELLALFVVRHATPGLRGTPFAKSLDRLWSKLAVKSGQVALVPETSTGFGFRAAAIDYGAHEGTIRLLMDGIAKRRAVRISYRKPNGNVSERTIEPGHIQWDGGLESMYVLSWCCERRAMRVFAIQRILTIDALDQEAVPRGATSEAALKRSFRIWYREQTTTVVLRFANEIAWEIRERQWHSSQKVKDLKNGGVEMRLEISAPEEMLRWLVGFGKRVEIVAPTSLAEAVQREHSDAMAVTPLASASRAMASAAKFVEKQTAKSKAARNE
jgi:predicted DNA-binding transcriptional regulator YafY